MVNQVNYNDIKLPIPQSSPLWENCLSIVSSTTEKVNLYIKENGLHWEQKIFFYPGFRKFSLNGSAFEEKESDRSFIELGLLLLISPRNIPEKFRVDDFSDERLNNDDYLNECIQWINDEYFKIEDLNPNAVTETDRNILRHFLVLASQPELFEKVVEFTIAHEIAHHFYGHLKEGIPSRDSFKRQKIFTSFTLAALMGMGGILIPKNTKLKILCGLIGGLFGILSADALCLSEIIARGKKNRNNEKEADLMAVKILGNNRGAIYDFDTALKASRDRFNRLSEAEQQRIVKQPRKYYKYKHPTCEERIAYLKAFHKNKPMKELHYFAPNVSSLYYQYKI